MPSPLAAPLVLILAASANATKKSFKLDLQKADGSKDKFPLLGMPKDDQWIL